MSNNIFNQGIWFFVWIMLLLLFHIGGCRVICAWEWSSSEPGEAGITLQQAWRQRRRQQRSRALQALLLTEDDAYTARTYVYGRSDVHTCVYRRWWTMNLNIIRRQIPIDRVILKVSKFDIITLPMKRPYLVFVSSNPSQCSADLKPFLTIST